MSGKGDARRPSAVPEKVVAENWRRTFAPDAPCPFCPLPPGLNRDHARVWKPCEQHKGV